jgi:hypothetical protein
VNCALDGRALLSLWEHALAQPPSARGDALLQAASDGEPRPRTIGERNARLANVHARLFGSEIALLSHCPACGTAVQFSGDCETLSMQAPSTSLMPTHRLVVDDHQVDFRLPDSADVAAASMCDTEEDFARALLQRCVLACSCGAGAIPPNQLPVSVLDALSRRMEALDPAACVSFDVDCPQCSTRWDARLDMAPLVWQKVQAAAERLLLDIDSLARAYGWTESDVLALTPTRRAAYLQMVAA